MRTIIVNGNPVVVIKRKRRRTTVKELIATTEKYKDPSFECEKPKNPMQFTKVSYSRACGSVYLKSISLPPHHLKNIFGEATRILSDGIEWVVKLPSKEIVKVVLTGRGAMIYAFQRTPTLEKWVDRLLNS